MPTELVKKCPELVPLITKILKTSLSTCVVPNSYKEAIVKPLLKKSGLDVIELKNYRPVSNLPFISKILERVVLNQIQSHLKRNNLLDINQSAYKHHHMTETALLRVLEKLLVNADQKLISILALLDLSAAFDAIDHDILIQRLHISFGIGGVLLQWFMSNLENRFQSVLIDQTKSNATQLKYGVPQGSVLGPILFTLYTLPLSDLIEMFDCDYHKFSDDTQLSKSAHLNNFPMLVKDIEACIESITKWMICNKPREI